jgi:acetylglutamate kinase
MMKKRVLLKLGGSSLDNPLTVREVAGLLHGYERKGYDVAIVHGGGPAINEELTRRGLQWRFIQGQRQTTPQMMEVIAEVLDGRVHNYVLDNLRELNFEVKSLSGAKDFILSCVPAQAELMQVGKIQSVDTRKILETWEQEKIPVISPLGVGVDGDFFNINADWAAVQLAVALQVEELIFLTDQDGIMDAHKHRLREVGIFDIERLIETGVITGGMYTKVTSMLHALKNGIKEVRVLNAFKASEMHEVPSMGTRMSC